jgi:hypothetical protein
LEPVPRLIQALFKFKKFIINVNDFQEAPRRRRRDSQFTWTFEVSAASILKEQGAAGEKAVSTRE